MNKRISAFICLFLAVGIAVINAGEKGDYDEPPTEYEEIEKAVKGGKEPVEGKEKPDDGLPKTGPTPVEKHGDDGDILAAKFKGFCQWGVGKYHKPGTQTRCTCMRCTCQSGGKWDCAYHFPYCPYYYCGNHIYNPNTQTCCCGKIHDKKTDSRCCGYFYYNIKTFKCCNYYSVKAINSHCPRDKI